jgi:hypothetical protein
MICENIYLCDLCDLRETFICVICAICERHLSVRSVRSVRDIHLCDPLNSLDYSLAHPIIPKSINISLAKKVVIQDFQNADRRH